MDAALSAMPAVDRRLQVLSETSRAFAEVVTDYQRLLDTVARSLAEAVGDSCTVRLIAPAGDVVELAAIHHPDPAIEVLLRDHVGSLRQRVDDGLTGRVIATGQPMMVPIVLDELRRTTSAEAVGVVERAAITAVILVPLRARGGVLGVLSVARHGRGAPYTADDVALLSDLGDRAGLAIDNARLYAELEDRVAARTRELEESNRRLQLTNRELESFSYAVAHDLRAPLRAIDGFSHALAEDCADAVDAVGRGYLDRIRANAQKMGKLIDALLALARVSRAELRREPVDLGAFARAALDHLRDGDPTRVVTAEIADGLVVEGDPALLATAIENLIANAWKFTATGGAARIEVGRERRDGRAVYFVRDDGVGFDMAYVEKLFGVFQRLHGAEFDGTGIGLATVQRIVQRHGGTIWAEGAPGRGATFYLTL